MGLQQDLDAFRAKSEEQIPGNFKAIMHRATEDLRASGILDGTIKVGDPLPPFQLTNQVGETISSDEILAGGPLVISFFRGVWCPYCNIELKALGAAAAEFAAAGATVVVISPQMTRSAVQTKDKNKLPFDVLIDDGNNYAKQLGIVFAMPEDLRGVYATFGIEVPDHNGDELWELPMPTRLVVRKDGTVTYAAIDPDYTIRPEPEETLAAVKAANG